MDAARADSLRAVHGGSARLSVSSCAATETLSRAAQILGIEKRANDLYRSDLRLRTRIQIGPWLWVSSKSGQRGLTLLLYEPTT